MPATTLQNGRYTLDDMIGSGAMGTVYRGIDTHTGTPIAVKALKPEVVKHSPTIVERFRREGEALRRLNHPNIVGMLTAVTDNDDHYLIMEYVSGGDLRDLLRQQPQLPIERALSIALDLADALTRAHRLNIIHRDLKPGNVLLADDGTPRLTDFGVAHIGLEPDITQAGALVGTFAYLSPEIYLGEPPDERADIWSFGVMLYEMLAGERPFDQPATGALISDILNTPLADIAAFRDDIPGALNDLLYRILTKNRADRIPSIRLVGAELEAILKNKEWLSSSQSGVAYVWSQPQQSAPHDGRAFATPTPSSGIRPHNLPVSSTPFVGRQTELAELLRLVRNPNNRLNTILGMGGMGKTRLAMEIGRILLNQSETVVMTEANFKDGIYFASLSPLAESSRIIPAIAEAVGYRFQAEADERQQLFDYLHDRNIFLILDNFEHLLDGAPLVADLLQAAPGLHLLVTSRQRLNLSGETVCPVGGMDIPQATMLSEKARESSAVQLFMQSARRAQIDFALTEADLAHVARICQLTHGSPLGIVLAAGWVDALSVAEIAQEVQRDIDFLETEMADMPERHRSMRAAFTYSWRLLDEEEKQAFARMSLFRGSFSRQAAQEVLGASLRMLTRLMNKSLIQRDLESGRYAVHELLRQFAAEKLKERGEVEAIRATHSQHYLSFLNWSLKALKGDNQMGAIWEINEDLENIRRAWQYAVDAGNGQLLATAVMPFFLFCEFSSKASSASEAFTAALQKFSPETHPQLFIRLRYALSRWQPMPFAERAEALDFVRQHGDPSDIVNWLLDHWMTIDYTSLFMAGNMESVAWAHEAIALSQQIGDPFSEANGLFTLGYMHIFLAQPDNVVAYIQQALEINAQIGNLYGQATATGQLGFAYIGYTDNNEAVLLNARQAMQINRQLGAIGMSANYQSLVGWALCHLGRLVECEQVCDEALATAKEAGLGMAIGQALALASYLSSMKGEYRQALAALNDFERIDPNPLRILFYAERMRGTAYLLQGDLAQGWPRIKMVAQAYMAGMMIAPAAVLIPLLAVAAVHLDEDELALTLLATAFTNSMSAPASLKEWPYMLNLRDSLQSKLPAEVSSAAWQTGSEAAVFDAIGQAIAVIDGKLAG
jgi:serine/threonine protein kinase/tetratricopeptide (TPR) repeat protein